MTKTRILLASFETVLRRYVGYIPEMRAVRREVKLRNLKGGLTLFRLRPRRVAIVANEKDQRHGRASPASWPRQPLACDVLHL